MVASLANINRRTTSKAKITMSIDGILNPINEQAALLKAQAKNAELAESYVKQLARQEVEHAREGWPNVVERNRGDYPGRMEDYYTASVTHDGDVVLDNPTDRARFFEFGTRAHSIQGSGPPPSGARPRGSRGRFSRGADVLKFPGGPGMDVYTWHVDHPGQSANPIMTQTMDDLLDDFGDNILDALEEELENV